MKGQRDTTRGYKSPSETTADYDYVDKFRWLVPYIVYLPSRRGEDKDRLCGPCRDSQDS